MATVSERAGVVGPSELREIAWDTGSENGQSAAPGMVIPRVFSKEGTSPYDEVEWELRTAEIKDERGRIIFQQTACEVPRAWGQLATNVVVSKYFYGDLGSGNGSPATGNREHSVRHLIDRVTRTIADWGRTDGYFATSSDANRFYDELTALCLNQYGSFNSPVWFNVGLFHRYGISGPANNWRWDEESRTVTKATTPTSIHKHRPASSKVSAMIWKESCAWRRAKRCSSSSDQAQAPTSLACAQVAKSSPAEANRPVQ